MELKNKIAYKSVYRLKKHLENNKVENILFISHSNLSADCYYKSIKKIINLDKFNIIRIYNDKSIIKHLDNINIKNTVGVMCGVWYKSKMVQNKSFWEFIDKIYTTPIDEIPFIYYEDEQTKTLNINIDGTDVSKDADEIDNELIKRMKVDVNAQDDL